MNRRDAVKHGAMALAATAVGAVGFAPFARDDYRPAGTIHAEDPMAHYVDHVTLNGERIESVEVACDVDGWLRRLVYEGPDAEARSGRHWRTRPEILTGDVRFVWKDVG